jgi:propanol-preferring alcohol dehydrogenase
MPHATAMLAKRGRLVFIGYSEDSYDVHPIQLIINEAAVVGSVGNTMAEFQEAIGLVASGKVRTLVDRTLPLAQWEEGLGALREGRLLGRVVLEP